MRAVRAVFYSELITFSDSGARRERSACSSHGVRTSDWQLQRRARSDASSETVSSDSSRCVRGVSTCEGRSLVSQPDTRI